MLFPAIDPLSVVDDLPENKSGKFTGNSLPNPVSDLIYAIIAIDQMSDDALDATLVGAELSAMAVKACLVPTAARLQSAFHRQRVRENKNTNSGSTDEQPGGQSAEDPSTTV